MTQLPDSCRTYGGIKIMKYSMKKKNDGTFNLLRDHEIIMNDGYQVISNVLYMLQTGKADHSECGEIADSILSKEK